MSFVIDHIASEKSAAREENMRKKLVEMIDGLETQVSQLEMQLDASQQSEKNLREEIK